MKVVEKSGQKFTFQGEVYTAKCFFGDSGIEYQTAKEAIENNQEGSIAVKNVEFDGATSLHLSMLLENE